jgi:hypothetical protein
VKLPKKDDPRVDSVGLREGKAREERDLGLKKI